MCELIYTIVHLQMVNIDHSAPFGLQLVDQLQLPVLGLEDLAGLRQQRRLLLAEKVKSCP